MGTTHDFPVAWEIQGKEMALALYSDGACRGNPGPGAWGCLAQNARGDILFEASGAEEETTNNKMELQGAIEALVRAGPYQEAPVFLFSDSKYVVDGLEKWVPGWKKRGWKKSDKKNPENLDLWKKLDELREHFLCLRFLWVKGHGGHPQNEYCDLLANRALDLLLA